MGHGTAEREVFVGLDYHQQSVQVCVVDGSGRPLANRACRNDWQAITEFAGRFGPVRRAAIESCSGAADMAEELVQQAGWSVDLAHPGYVRRMKQNPDKTDYSDARMLADLTRVGYLPRVWLAPRDVRELRRLTRYRQQLVDERRAMKLRITASLRDQRITGPRVRRWTLAWLTWLEGCEELSEHSRWIIGRQLRRIRELEAEIRLVMDRLNSVTQDDAIVEKLLTIEGIGEVTAYVLRAEIGRFDRFRTGKQLARFCGLSPRNASTGQKQADAGLIRAADGRLRATLIQAGHRLRRHHQRWANLATELTEAGKPTSVAVAAITNRWVRGLYHQMESIRAA